MAGDPVPNDVLKAFCKDPTTWTVTTLGLGNINDTYLVRSATYSFVLQRINNEVFPDPLRVIENFYKITNHLRHKKAGIGRQLQVAVPELTLKNRLFFRDSKGAFWRGQSYLPHESCQMLAGPDQARRVGRALATFHRLVSDLEAKEILDPLPGFHNLPRYLQEYDGERQSIKTVANEQKRFCMASIDRYRQQAATLENAKTAGILTLQPIHGDPKVDNFLFSDQGEVVAPA